MRTVSAGGPPLEELARKVYVDIKEAFPESRYTSLKDIAGAITALEVRSISMRRCYRLRCADYRWVLTNRAA